MGTQWNVKSLDDVVDDSWLDPVVFWEKYISVSHPVLFKKIAHRFPAFNKWTDQYLKENLKDLEVNVEIQKKENRNLQSSVMKFVEFLDRSRKDSLYIVDSLPLQLYADLYLPTCLSCGTLAKSIIDISLWVSSGGTKSVLHTDALENIHCVLSGSKTFLLSDKTHSEKIIFDHPEDGYSSLNVDEVDLCQYPEINAVPWYNVSLNEGDCLYIPYMWFHQVNSKPLRSVGINFWFQRMLWLNISDCELGYPGRSASLALDEVTFCNDEDLSKFEVISLFEEHSRINISVFDEILKEFAISKEAVLKLFHSLDQDNDEIVTLEDLYNYETGTFLHHLKKTGPIK